VLKNGELRKTRLAELSRRYSKALARALIAMTFGLGDLLAGGVIASQIDFLRAIPWAMAVYPGMLSARGAVNGVLSGRLSTGMNIGSMKPSLWGNTEEFWSTISAAFTLTLLASASLTLTVGSTVLLLGGRGGAGLPGLFAVILASMGISQAIMAPTTAVAASLFFRAGVDPDYVTYPSMSTVADFVVSAVYVATLKVYSSGRTGRLAISLAAFAYALCVLILAAKHARGEVFRFILREASLAILIVSVIVAATGNLLVRVETVVRGRTEIYVIYPALLTMVGDFGSIVGSIATTKLAIGTSRPDMRLLADIAPEALGAWTAWFAAIQAFGAVTAVVSGSGSSVEWLAGVLALGGTLSTATMLAVSLGVAVLTFRMGLDPDNFVNPIESSLADAVTTGSLLLALGLAA